MQPPATPCPSSPSPTLARPLPACRRRRKPLRLRGAPPSCAAAAADLPPCCRPPSLPPTVPPSLPLLQAPGGALLLLEQGVVGHVLLLAQWLLAPEGGDLMGETPVPPGLLAQVRLAGWL